MARNNLPRIFAEVLLIIVLSGIGYGIYRNYHEAKTESKNNPPIATDQEQKVEGNQVQKDNPSTSPAPLESESGLDYPIAGFSERITKKPFGIYVTTQNSPVQPERFTGYHTAVDVEYEDVTDDVPVFAINDCQVIISKVAQGYGGVFIISSEIQGSKHSVVYGHIRPSTLPRSHTFFKKGAQMAFLGTGYSAETDGERRHLHFGVLADSGTDLRGYVQNQDELSGWIDPMTVF